MTSNKIYEYPERKTEEVDALVAKCSRCERKGKTMPYTFAKGSMFSLYNKACEIGICFSKEVQEKYLGELDTTRYESYGAVMKGCVLIPETMWKDQVAVAKLLDESYDQVMTLNPK